MCYTVVFHVTRTGTHTHWARVCIQRPRTYGKVIRSSFCEGTLVLQYGCGRDSPSFYLKTRAGCQALRKMGHPRVRSFVPFLPLCLAGCIWMLMFFKYSCIFSLLSAIKKQNLFRHFVSRPRFGQLITSIELYPMWPNNQICLLWGVLLWLEWYLGIEHVFVELSKRNLEWNEMHVVLK